LCTCHKNGLFLNIFRNNPEKIREGGRIKPGHDSFTATRACHPLSQSPINKLAQASRTFVLSPPRLHQCYRAFLVD
jgi:hypothetical protein